MPTLTTLKIQHPTSPDNFLIINESDYQPGTHQLWSEPNERQQELQREGIGEDAKEQSISGIETDAAGAEEAQKERDVREAELMEMDWREIKAIAESYSISKPEGGWDESIPLILVAEYGDN